MIREIIISIRSTLALWFLTALVYPLLILLIGQGVFPHQANGSLIVNTEGTVIGSALIGQSFTTDRYFWGRPSTITYSEGEAAAPTGLSGASNLAPSNPDLLTRIQQASTLLQQAGIAPTADLLYTSGSGLDPHISPAAAQAQINRVAQARSLEPNAVEQLVARHTQGRFLGIFGEPAVNIVTLNIALDQG